MRYCLSRLLLAAALIFSIDGAFAAASDITADSAPVAKIVGGREALPGEFPSVVALLRTSQPNTFLAQFCAGALVQPGWVLTAAHCVAGLFPSEVQVQIGRNDLSFDVGDRTDVSAIVVHPAYFNRGDVLFNDVALLALAEQSLTQTLEVPAIFDNFAPPGTLATAIGWGTTDPFLFSNFPTNLRAVDLPIVSNDVCNLVYGGDIRPEMVCAGFVQGGKDTCAGDSGGPLLVRSSDGRMKQVGITSFGIGCGFPGFPGVYTRVANFSQFISNVICSDQAEPPAPFANVTVNGNTVTGSWNAVPGATGYQLFYAPLPDMSPIASIDLGAATSISVNVPSGLSFAAAVVARNGVCYDPVNKLSNIVSFTVP